VEAAVFLAVEAEKALVRRIGFETSGQAEQQVEAGGLKSRREKAGPLFHVVIFDICLSPLRPWWLLLPSS
jgi:hypothetical protein